MADDFRLLLKPVLRERPARFQCIIVAAKGMAPKDQVDALLVLPDMGHFVNEQALPFERALAEIRTVERALGAEPEVAVGRHRDLAGLEGPPFAGKDPDPRIVDSIAEHRTGERNFGVSEGAMIHQRVCGSSSPAEKTSA